MANEMVMNETKYKIADQRTNVVAQLRTYLLMTVLKCVRTWTYHIWQKTRMRPESKQNKLKYPSMSLFLPTLFDTYISEKKFTKKLQKILKLTLLQRVKKQTI